MISAADANPTADAASIRVSAHRGVISRLVRQRASRVGLGVLAVLTLMAVLGPTVAPYDPYASVLARRLLPPNAAHLLGTDVLGRDILSRLLYGAGLSLATGATVVVLATVVGSWLGVVAGYVGGWIDAVVMRVIDALLCFPGLLLAIGVTAALGPGFVNTMLAIAIANVPVFAQVTRSSTLRIRELLFIEAARSSGAHDFRVILRHILPNLAGTLTVLATLRFGTAILTGASLSFLGLGAPPPTPEWGAMLNEGRVYLRTMPHVALVPGIAITLTVLACNLVGDAVRDALDPRLRHEQ
jgi:ABC-type dipeptide/oligopeptide/nickel transport system permease subunit